jgi:hypothetical protein
MRAALCVVLQSAPSGRDAVSRQRAYQGTGTLAGCLHLHVGSLVSGHHHIGNAGTVKLGQPAEALFRRAALLDEVPVRELVAQPSS